MVAMDRRAREHDGAARLWARAAMVLLTLWALLAILPDLYRLAAPLASFGLSVDNNGIVHDVQEPFESADASPAARAGIQPGARLDLGAMRCTRPGSDGCAAIVALLGAFGGVEYTASLRPITLVLRGSGGAPPRRVTLAPAPAPLHFAARLVLLLDTLVGAGFVITAFLLVWTRPSRMRWGFFLYALWFNPGQDYVYYAVLQLWPPAVLIAQALDALGQGAGYAGLLAFALSFPEERPAPGGRWLDALLPGFGLLMAGLALAASANLFGLPTGTLSHIQFFAIIPLDLLAIALLLLRLRRMPPQDEARMRWAIAGCAIGLPAFLAAELCQSSDLPARLLGVTPSLTAIEILYLLHGVIAYFVGTAVRRRRVVSVAIPLRRGAILASLSFVLGVPVVYLHDQVSSIGDQMHETLHLPAWLWLAVVSPIALIVLSHLHHHSVAVIERLFNRRYHHARARLAAAGRAMLTVRDFAEVDRLLTETPAESLRLTSAAIFRQEAGGFRRTGPAPGWPEASLATLDTALDAIALRCLKTGQPEPLPRGGWSRAGLPPDDYAPCLAVPVRGGVAESLAVALYGPHLTGSDINPDERRLLGDFADRAALGYDRVEVETLRRALEALRREIRRPVGQTPFDSPPAAF